MNKTQFRLLVNVRLLIIDPQRFEDGRDGPCHAAPRGDDVHRLLRAAEGERRVEDRQQGVRVAADEVGGEAAGRNTDHSTFNGLLNSTVRRMLP